MLWKCELCKHLSIGVSAPETCLVCGAKKFSPHALSDAVRGTLTEENLRKAFAGESQANRKYTAFALLAELAGDEEAAKAFRQAAADETAHALSLLLWLKGVGSTRENLLAASDGENHEHDSMYPEFARVAREEGFAELATYFEFVARHEKRHAGVYEKLAETRK